jgi:hypothetical protein
LHLSGKIGSDFSQLNRSNNDDFFVGLIAGHVLHAPGNAYEQR